MDPTSLSIIWYRVGPKLVLLVEHFVMHFSPFSLLLCTFGSKAIKYGTRMDRGQGEFFVHQNSFSGVDVFAFDLRKYFGVKYSAKRTLEIRKFDD